MLPGIDMFAVGISQLIAEEELMNIASSPKQVLMLKTFDQLLVSLQKIMKVVCRKSMLDGWCLLLLCHMCHSVYLLEHN